MSQLNTDGYQVIPTLFEPLTVDQLLHLIQANPINAGFGIREFLPNNPEITEVLRNESAFCQLIRQHLSSPTCIRSIYFDKPPNANWVVGWHQDLTVNLNSKPEEEDWQNVRSIKQRIVAQPPLVFLENMVTVRLHLDDTDDSNGALRVIPGTHQNGVIRTDSPNMTTLQEAVVVCHINRGGAMLMKPLMLHASRRSKDNHSSRRVIHLEFASGETIGSLDLQEATTF